MNPLVDAVRPVLVLLGLVGSGLIGGLFFAFSTAVMPALRQLPPAAGAAAMQHVNRVILNPLFGLVFGGTALVCLLLLVAAPFGSGGGTAWIVVGALLYLVGCIAVTMVFNVPLNNALDVADPATAEGARLWADYLSRWTAWNHLRGLACALAAAALAIGLWQ